MQALRQCIRWLLVVVLVGLLLVILSGVVGEFFIELARERGWYESPSLRVDAAMSGFNAFVTQQWVLFLATLVGGLTGGVWLDALLRKLTKTLPIEVYFDPRNTGERFWSKGEWLIGPDQHALGVEYRLEVKNNSDRTIRDIVVDVTLLSKSAPSRATFVRGRKQSADINPLSSEMVEIMLVGRDDENLVETIICRASAADVPAHTKRFSFDSSKMPRLRALD